MVVFSPLYSSCVLFGSFVLVYSIYILLLLIKKKKKKNISYIFFHGFGRHGNGWLLGDIASFFLERLQGRLVSTTEEIDNFMNGL